MSAEPAPYAEVHETHTGVVLLLGETAYKLKKPVNLPFVDFTTADRRRAACEREVELNRRLCPDVYLGIGDLGSPSGDAEPLVVMRRMPSAMRLSAVLGSPDGLSHVREIARLIARFHAGAERGGRIAAQGRRDAVRQRWRNNLDEVERLPDQAVPADVVSAVRARSERYLTGRSALFDERIAQGHVIDGHGDLLADDIFCLDDGPRVLDCLEFDDRLRYVDQIDDVACLAMDLLRSGHPTAAAHLVRWYQEFSGDDPPASLVHHYIAYRAFMRAKVSAVRRIEHVRPEGAGTEAPEALARLALAHLDTAAVRLVLVGGPPGSGKSTLAGPLAGRLGCSLISSDGLRRELAGIDAESPAAADFEEGIYSRTWTARTYAEMLRRARLLLQRGESVVLDASWRDERLRSAAARLAAQTTADLVQLRCDAPTQVAASRIRTRLAARRRSSDADELIAARMRSAEDAWPESIAIDTDRTRAHAVDDAVAAVLAGASDGRLIAS